MKKRGDRTMSELYDRTQKIPRSKIEGISCNEPLDRPANETAAMKEKNKSPSRKRSTSGEDSPYRKPESGTCNVCNTPCSSCLHRMREGTDSCSFLDTCNKHFHCEAAEAKSKFRNPNKPEPFDMGIVKLEGQGENTSCVTKYTKEKDAQRVDSLRESSSDNCKESAQQKDTFDSTDSREKSDSNSRVLQKNSVLHEKLFDGLESCDYRNFRGKDQMHGQKVVEVKNQDIDNVLIDVKVCDICGDTGREELLATCSRCIDGAEHTYCMRVRLEKLPEGDWLCEECQLKDKAEKEKKRRIQTTPIPTPRSEKENEKKCQLKDKAEKEKRRHIQTTPIPTPRSEKENKNDLENSKNPFSHHKKLHISTDSAVYASVPPPSPQKSFKEAMSPRKTSNLSGEVSTKTEIGFLKEVISPRRTSGLSRENSIKMEIGSPKGGSGQIAKNSHSLSRSRSLSNAPLPRDVEKGRAELLPPKGTMTKHLSFKNLSMKPKVKSMTESIPPKQKTPLSSISKSTDEARPFKRLIKSSSLKETSSGRFNTGSVKLMKPPSSTIHVDPPKPLEMRGEREKSTLERNGSLRREKHPDVLAQLPRSVVKEFESKAEGSLPKKPECSTSCDYKEPAPEDKKMNKAALIKQHEANKNPRSVLVSKEGNKKFGRLNTAVRTVVPERRDAVKDGISDRPKETPSRSGVSHTNENQKAISTNMEYSKSRFCDKSRVQKAPKDVFSETCSLEKEESIDLDVISPNIGVEKMKAPKDLLSRSSSLEKEKKVDTNVIYMSDRVEKVKPCAKNMLSQASLLEKPMDLSAISSDVGFKMTKSPTEMVDSNAISSGKVKPCAKNMLSQASLLEKPMDLSAISSDVGFKMTKSPMEMVDSNAISSGKVKPCSKNMLSQASLLEKPMDLSAISSDVGFKMTKAPTEMVDSNAISANVKDPDLKPLAPVVSADSSLLVTPSEALVIPEQDFVWHGSFEIMQARKQGWETFKGIQAHLSTHASPKVSEVVAKFSNKLQLEEVPCGTAWPVLFQHTKPGEEHVAVFFFARDLESYEVSYSRLLQRMIGNNLALRGDICGAELLIFPSDKLPERSQRWNSLFYLWGIFRAWRRESPKKTILHSPKLLCGPPGNFPARINEDVKPNKELIIDDNLPKPKLEDSAGYLCVELEPCKTPMEQNAWTCLGPSALISDQPPLIASYAASSSQVCLVKAEDANGKTATLERSMPEHNFEVNTKTLSLEKPTVAELRPGNKRVRMSETSLEDLHPKRKREHDCSHIETSSLLNKPVMHPLSIDLEKHAQSPPMYSIEYVGGTYLRNAGLYKTANNAISSGDEDVTESIVPNLNLALGDNNHSQKEVLPLPLFPSVLPKEEDSNVVLSLSLTIGPPASEKGEDIPVRKMQQFLPEKPGVKAPFRLFGGYIE